MERLELSLTEDRGVLLYDPLHDTQAGPGLISRVASAGGTFWSADAIGVWPSTRRVREARADLPESQEQRLAQRIDAYRGPVQIDTKAPTPVAEPPSYDLWQTRVQHMSGRPAPSVGSYQTIRLAGRNPDPLLSPNDQSLNSKAADEAFYWTAQAQYDAEEFETAASTAGNYIADGGDRSDESAGLIALCLASQGKTDEAAKAIDDLPETTPGLPRLNGSRTAGARRRRSDRFDSRRKIFTAEDTESTEDARRQFLCDLCGDIFSFYAFTGCHSRHCRWDYGK